jgi:hypothetical protein
MTDLGLTIAPKSDQLNADDLLAGPRTITVTRVTGSESKEQPINIYFEGDQGRPYKPCKSMRRVLVHVWGRDGNKYAGRSMTIFRDPKVRFGDIETGGIRISHVSDITEPKSMALTASRGNKKPYEVKPLKGAPAAGESKLASAERWVAEYKQALDDAGSLDEIAAVHAQANDGAARMKAMFPDLYAEKVLGLRPADAPEIETAVTGFGGGFGEGE